MSFDAPHTRCILPKRPRSFRDCFHKLRAESFAGFQISLGKKKVFLKLQQNNFQNFSLVWKQRDFLVEYPWLDTKSTILLLCYFFNTLQNITMTGQKFQSFCFFDLKMYLWDIPKQFAQVSNICSEVYLSKKWFSYLNY